MTENRLHDVTPKSDDVRKLMEAIARGIDPTDIQEALNDLGLHVQLDTVDWGNTFGTISIEGGENETGCIITLQLARIEVGFDSITVSHEDES